MESQVIYTVRYEASEIVEENAIYLPKHNAATVYSTNSPHWLILYKDGTSRIYPHFDKDSGYVSFYTFLTKEEAEAQLLREAEKKKERLRREIEQKQKELEALK